MTNTVDELELSSETPGERRARLLAESDLEYLYELVQLRRECGLSQTEIAERMGVTQATVSDFERQDNDPKLSTLRRYAYAVGALVRHEVVRDVVASSAAGVGWAAGATVLADFSSNQHTVARPGWGQELSAS